MNIWNAIIESVTSTCCILKAIGAVEQKGSGLRGYPLHTAQIPHVSLLCTVCDKEIWVEFTRYFPKTLNTEYVCHMDLRGFVTKYEPFGEDSDCEPPSFLQHPSQVFKVGHTIDRCIILGGCNNFTSKAPLHCPCYVN